MSEPGMNPETARQWRLVVRWAEDASDFGALIRSVLRDVAEHWGTP